MGPAPCLPSMLAFGRTSSKPSRQSRSQGGVSETPRQNLMKNLMRPWSICGTTWPRFPRWSPTRSSTSSKSSRHSFGALWRSFGAASGETHVLGYGSEAPSRSVGQAHQAQWPVLRPCFRSEEMIAGNLFVCRTRRRRSETSSTSANASLPAHASLPQPSFDRFRGFCTEASFASSASTLGGVATAPASASTLDAASAAASVHGCGSTWRSWGVNHEIAAAAVGGAAAFQFSDPSSLERSSRPGCMLPRR
mmetsp:Transcript_22373/g.75694  ORF Transcript_22373/g.75694 Transcript_22373/m.75694 type:complete len:250 (+) Transcript_22373:164-913(+)